MPKANLLNLETFEFNTSLNIVLSAEGLMALLTRAGAHSNFHNGNSILSAELTHCSPSAQDAFAPSTPRTLRGASAAGAGCRSPARLPFDGRWIMKWNHLHKFGTLAAPLKHTIGVTEVLKI